MPLPQTAPLRSFTIPLSLSHLRFPFGIANSSRNSDHPSNSPRGLTSYATSVLLVEAQGILSERCADLALSTCPPEAVAAPDWQERLTIVYFCRHISITARFAWAISPQFAVKWGKLGDGDNFGKHDTANLTRTLGPMKLDEARREHRNTTCA